MFDQLNMQLEIDWKRMVISQRSGDSLAFKIPPLRNVELLHPYMHNGRFKTLREVQKAPRWRQNYPEALRSPSFNVGD